MDEYTRKKPEGTNKRSGDAPLDQMSGALPMLSDLERDTNVGHGWEFCHVAQGVANNETVLIQLNTGADSLRVRRFGIWGDASLARLELFRNPTLTDGTAVIPIKNLSHASARELPAGIAAFSNPTNITDIGERYHDTLLGGGEDLALGSRAWRLVRDVETVLAPNTKYLIRITNLNGVARNFAIGVIFCA